MAVVIVQEMGLAQRPLGMSRQQQRDWGVGALQALKDLGVNLATMEK